MTLSIVHPARSSFGMPGGACVSSRSAQACLSFDPAPVGDEASIR